MQRLLQYDTQVAAGLYFTVKSLNLAVQCGIIEIRPKYEWRKFLWQIGKIIYHGVQKIGCYFPNWNLVQLRIAPTR